LQENARYRCGGLGARRSTNQEAAAKQDDPHDWSAVTLLPIAADARKAAWEHLSDKGNTLGRVLLNAEEEYGKDDKAAARTDPEKPRGEAPTRPTATPSNRPWASNC
jgi:hypothetical protein